MQKKACKTAIRNQYQEMGVEQFYMKNGTEYSNPHFLFIEELLIRNKDRIDYSNALDLCCGAGEVSLILRDQFNEISFASDPFTQNAFKKNLKRECFSWSFDDIITKGIEQKFTVVICSFAMHLCKAEKLYPLVSQIFKSTEELIILTPHKRPALEKLTGVVLNYKDFVLTERGKKVRLKSYSHSFIKPVL